MRNKGTLLAALLLTSCSAPESPKPAADTVDRVVVLTAANFDAQVLRNKRLVLVDVGAPG